MITVFIEQDLAAGSELELSGGAAQHVRVRRGQTAEPLRLVDGRGTVALGALASVGKRAVTAIVKEVQSLPRPSELIALVPVADRDRMLWAAEKCVELQVTRWQPVLYERSKSVSPRGEGDKFSSKVRARMKAALEQSGGAWIPEVNPELDVADAWREIRATSRLILQRDGESAAREQASGAVAFAVGPEGGFEKDEVEDALRHGWRSVSLSTTTLRFETAIVAAAAVIRAMQLQDGGVA
jgi:16S rRNA (uracil1498-N3)-methyltransferase